jgi:hypothetical protein
MFFLVEKRTGVALDDQLDESLLNFLKGDSGMAAKM